MRTPSKIHKAFLELARRHSAGGVQAHLARLLAGWLSLFVHPPLPPGPPTSLRQVLLGGALLTAAMLLLGPVLGALTPALKVLGQLGFATLMVGLFGAANVWRYFAGKTLLSALEPQAS